MFEHVFNTAGVFPYHCGIHPTIMRGNQVTVSATATDTLVSVSIVGTVTPGFAPSAVAIKPGGKVRWTNDHSVPHTVTSDS